ncbi:MAG: sigma 54-interacting transcriptional regulator [Myxococcota bacterium]
MDERTRERTTQGIPVQGIAVRVEAGPDAGNTASSEDRLTIGTAHDNDLVLTDPTVSRYHLELRRDGASIGVRDLESTNGTFVGSVQLREGKVAPGTTLTLGDSQVRIGDGARGSVDLHAGSESLGGLYGVSAVMRRLMAKIERASASDVAVLLTGESGTGKERVARALHTLGTRSKGPFVTVDCGALAPTLVASELFGHEPGAFTGATHQHQGAFERANGGTLFLDEIGELPEALQPVLLGALERRRFRRVGGRSEIAVDVRVVSATHREIRSDVNRGRFRLDLFYRLAVVHLEVPPLRERVDDIPLLLQHFLRELGADGTLFDASAMAALERHRWPGNVRELRNFVEATVAMGEAPLLDDRVDGQGDLIASVLDQPWRSARAAVVHALEARYLPHLMKRAKNNISAGARLAKMDRGHLTDLLKRHGLKEP